MPTLDVDPATIDPDENYARSLRGELYYGFFPDRIAARARAKAACDRYNNAGSITRRKQVELWRDILNDKTPLPPLKASQIEDDALFDDDPWIESPVCIDFGEHTKVGKKSYMNFNITILDTCRVVIGERVLIAANVSLYAATHPLDPVLRNGTAGPELGKEIHIEDDCFIGGNVVICPGVTIGKGSTIGAGSVVTRDIPEYSVAAGNPARVTKTIVPGSEKAPPLKEKD